MNFILAQFQIKHLSETFSAEEEIMFWMIGIWVFH
jgi:hypothetical protein